ncbi:hypothetical protein WDW86_10175 [Bdellovibrionota bacterium FG-2]
MIFTQIKPYLTLRLLKGLLWIIVVAWAATASVWAYRIKPQVMLIGLDDSGTRIITSAEDPLISRERAKFVREFIRLFYNFDDSSFERNMNHASKLIGDTLWNQKDPDIQAKLKQLKKQPLSQEAKLLDLREVTDEEFEADLGIHIKSKIYEANTKFRIVVKIAPKQRSAENPYPLEVTEIHETEYN